MIVMYIKLKREGWNR